MSFRRWFDLIAAGAVTAADFKACFQCTPEQGEQVDEIIATQPSTGLLPTLLNAKAIAQWPAKVGAIMEHGSLLQPPLHTEAAMKAALGIT